MLWTMAAFLFIIWLISVLTGHLLNGMIHILLFLAIVSGVIRLFEERNLI